MRTTFACLALVVYASVGLVSAKDRAILKKDSDTQYHVDVIIERVPQAGASVVAALYKVDQGNRILVKKYVGVPTVNAGNTSFAIGLPNPPQADDSFVVAVFEFPAANDTYSYDLTVAKVLTTSLVGANAQCPRGILLRLRSSEYSQGDWEFADAYFRRHSIDGSKLGQLETLTSTTHTRTGFDRAKVLTPIQVALASSQMLVCLTPQAQLPGSSYQADITFSGSTISDLQTLTEKGLTGVSSPKPSTSVDDNGLPGTRGQEVNLDFGVSFKSSIEEVEQPDKTKIRARVSRGTFDLRLSPWLYVGRRKHFDLDQKKYHFFNPFFLDAAVSTGKIEEDTLSMNRVILGSEYEFRYYNFKKNAAGENIDTPYQTAHRFILKGTHASDRDFKQLEYAGTFEYQPVLGSLNHPLYSNWKFEGSRRVAGDFGYEIKPRFGFSLGRTYARRNPAEALKVSPTIRRFFTGLDMTFNLSRYLSLSLSDTFWVRGEADDDRFHNHFKGVIEAPLGRPFENSVHSFFLTFERGNEPPFATPDVNVVKMGYRIRSDGWFRRPR